MGRRFLIVVTGLLLLALVGFVSPGDGRGAGVDFQYISPRPGAALVSAETTIAFRLNHNQIRSAPSELIDQMSIGVVGGGSGRHGGELFLSGDGRTFIFEPERPFEYNEQVTVFIEGVGDGRPFSRQFSFTISPPLPTISDAERWPELVRDEPPRPVTPTNPLPIYRTVPADFPTLDVYTAPGTGDGYIFLSHFNYSNPTNGKAYLLMLGENGEPVYYNRLHPLLAALDFKKQPNGWLTYYDTAQKKFIALDKRYNFAGSFQSGNGYPIDVHDLQILGNNHALIMAEDYQLIDMSVIVPGGNPAAVVVGCIVQELDSQGNVVFEWRSWDHIPITDSNQDLTADYIRYIHCNSIEQDLDGHLLLSSRHLDEVTKINRQTGDIIWRLGGRQNQFYFVNDPGFFYQHDARRLPNGRLSLYDNRAYQEPEFSRAVEYVLDEQNMIATRAYQFRNTPDTFGGAMGNYQRLPGGNVLVGWGCQTCPF